MTPVDSVHRFSRTDPRTVAPDRQGWRGLGIPGHHKRKCWTLLHNEQVLVTALLLIPGELSIRHSHESGELAIRYDHNLIPVVTWNPPGMVHPPIPGDVEQAGNSLLDVSGMADQDRGAIPDAGLAELIEVLLTEQREIRQVLEKVVQADSRPYIAVDVLFPPFKTTIEDPAYPNRTTIVGQWYD